MPRSIRSAAKGTPRSRLRAAGLALLVALGSGGCSLFDAPRDTRGALFDPELVKELVPGVQTRRDVLALLGTPTIQPAFDDLSWYYVGAITRQRVGRFPGLVEQDVIAIRFALDGTVERIDSFGLADGQDVRLVSRETPTPGTEQNVLQQLFGNIGRFSNSQAQRSGQ